MQAVGRITHNILEAIDLLEVIFRVRFPLCFSFARSIRKATNVDESIVLMLAMSVFSVLSCCSTSFNMQVQNNFSSEKWFRHYIYPRPLQYSCFKEREPLGGAAFSNVKEMTRSYNRLGDNIEGSRQECCISSMIYSRYTSFWSGTLDIYYSHCLPVPSSWERKSSFLLVKFSYNLSQTSLSGFNDTQKAIGRGFCLFFCLVGWLVSCVLFNFLISEFSHLRLHISGVYSLYVCSIPSLTRWR